MKCPCCGGEVDDLPVQQLVKFQWSAIETTVIRTLVRHYPSGVDIEALVYEVYGTRRNQPENALGCIRLSLWRLRKKLAPLGWHIPRGKGGNGFRHVHCLVKL